MRKNLYKFAALTMFAALSITACKKHEAVDISGIHTSAAETMAETTSNETKADPAADNSKSDSSKTDASKAGSSAPPPLGKRRPPARRCRDGCRHPSK